VPCSLVVAITCITVVVTCSRFCCRHTTKHKQHIGGMQCILSKTRKYVHFYK